MAELQKVHILELLRLINRREERQNCDCGGDDEKADKQADGFNGGSFLAGCHWFREVERPLLTV